MNWASICENPLLANLPYKIQTDKWGNIVMSPASNKHGIYQAKIVVLLSRLMHIGTVIAECSVNVTVGVHTKFGVGTVIFLYKAGIK